MPTLIEVELSHPARDHVASVRAAGGQPDEIVVRCLVDAARHLKQIGAAFGTPHAALERQLDEVANAPSPPAVGISAHRLQAYARALRATNRAAARVAVEPRMVLRIPDTLLAGWTCAATAARQPLDHWISDALIAGPGSAIAWEASAAERGLSLGEWMWSAGGSALNLG
jgi:hypothetical protein